jgi:hypothetical protein
LIPSAKVDPLEGIRRREFLDSRVTERQQRLPLRHPLFGGVPPMNRNDQYLSYAADCHLMACMTRDQHERQTWLDMARSHGCG